MFKNIILFIAATLTCIGGSLSKNSPSYFWKNENPKSLITITADDFENLNDSECSLCNYTHRNYKGSRYSSSVYFLSPNFSKILYNPNNSLLYIEGTLFAGEKPFSAGQIITARYSDRPKDSTCIKFIDIVKLGKDGKFEATISISDSLQLMFAPQETYDLRAKKIMTTPIIFMRAYDIYKLPDMYKLKN